MLINDKNTVPDSKVQYSSRVENKSYWLNLTLLTQIQILQETSTTHTTVLVFPNWHITTELHQQNAALLNADRNNNNNKIP